jgi:prepilin-type N-terminal cleavage/methylation domain-containing protein
MIFSHALSFRVRRRQPRGARAGFSLVEVMISMTILAIVLSSLAGLSFLVAKRGRTNSIVTKRNFALQQQANRLGAMSADALVAAGSGTKTMTVGDFTFTRAITITTVSTKRWTIKVKVTPADDPTKADSVTFDRTRPATGTPLCTVC